MKLISSGMGSRLLWGTLWLLLAICTVAWLGVALFFGALALIVPSGLTVSDWALVVVVFTLAPAALLAARVSLVARRFDLLTTVVICGAWLTLFVEGSRFSDAVLLLDVVAVALAVAAGLRRSFGAASAFVIVLAMAVTLWLALNGKMTLYELT